MNNQYAVLISSEIPELGESADTLKYLDIYYFISNIVRLYYMPKNSNSEENEFGKLYAYGSIIGLHRCHIPDKRQ